MSYIFIVYMLYCYYLILYYKGIYMILKIYLRSDASKIKSSEITDYQYHDIEYILKVNIDIIAPELGSYIYLWNDNVYQNFNTGEEFILTPL